MAQQSPTVILISSHVARGSVGNRIMSFALERLGLTVWEVPTIILPYHPGQAPADRIVPEDDAFERLLNDIAERSEGKVDAILSGYLGTSAQADHVADLVRRIRQDRPDCLYLCDPVIGDKSTLYVIDRIAETIRDHLVPISDIATPNAFECGWLAGEGTADLTAAAKTIPSECVIVTSVPGLMRGHIGNLLVSDTDVLLAEHPAVESRVKGTGDLFSALYLGHILLKRSPRRALQLATSSVFELMAAAARQNLDDLPATTRQTAIIQPQAMVNMRQMAPGLTRKPRPL